MTTSVFFDPKGPDQDQALQNQNAVQGPVASPLQTVLGPILPATKTTGKKVKPQPPKPPKPPTPKGKKASSGDQKPIQAEPDKEYKWNLPPHKFSLPVRPVQVQREVYQSKGVRAGLEVPESYRRGRMWWYANANQDYKTSDTTSDIVRQRSGSARKYGFQFLWNPESYTTSVQLNTDVTPSVADRFAGVAGLFPSGENISISLRLDRTNDFYHMRHMLKKDYNANLGQYVPPAASNAVFAQMASFYQTNLFANPKDNIGKKIKTLMELGTIADLEYLFVAINGPGWKNIIGRPTGDIGFLSATLLRIDIGPSSYVGYVNSLTINHIAFNQDMTPIRTDVQFSMNLMASAGIAGSEESKASVYKEAGSAFRGVGGSGYPTTQQKR
jgi:hypothetical protein